MSLSNRAMLVNLSVSQWTARKFDKSETQALARRHGTDKELARVNKSLLPFADSLAKVHTLTGAIRTEYYKRTLPWTQEGVQILKSDGYIDFTQWFNTARTEWLQAVDDFVMVYPALQADARLLLNSLYRDEDYPDPAQVRAKFNIDIGFQPVPQAGDWRVDIGDDALETLRQQIEERVTASQGVAMQAAWQRVYDVVAKAHERLASPDAIFRDSLVDNAVELCRLLPSLNLTDDPQLEAMRYEIEGALCRHNPDTLRKAPDVRSEAAAKLKEIMDKMGHMYATS